MGATVTTTHETIDGILFEVTTDDDGTVLRVPIGPAPVDRFAAFAEALDEALANDEVSVRDAMRAALDAVG